MRFKDHIVDFDDQVDLMRGAVTSEEGRLQARSHQIPHTGLLFGWSDTLWTLAGPSFTK